MIDLTYIEVHPFLSSLFLSFSFYFFKRQFLDEQCNIQGTGSNRSSFVFNVVNNPTLELNISFKTERFEMRYYHYYIISYSDQHSYLGCYTRDVSVVALDFFRWFIFALSKLLEMLNQNTLHADRMFFLFYLHIGDISYHLELSTLCAACAVGRTFNMSTGFPEEGHKLLLAKKKRSTSGWIRVDSNISSTS